MTRLGKVVVGGLVAVLVFVGVGFLVDREGGTPFFDSHGCTAEVDGLVVDLTLEQAENAALITAIAMQRGLPARAASIALATAYQESEILNIEHGDRDSVGLFQQRPSQGWGTVEQILDPVYSTNAFYDGAGRGRGLRGDGDHRGRPGGAALRLPRRLRRPRGRRPGARVGAHRQPRGRLLVRHPR